MPKVKIYTTPSCFYCKMAKQFFQDNGVQYEEKDITKDPAALEEMHERFENHMGVPVIDIDGNVFLGFDKEGISKLLNIKSAN